MYIELSGREDAQAETLVLSAGLGGCGHYWQPQLEALRQRYRVVTYDQRGTGRSADTLPDGYSMRDMAAELATLLSARDITHFSVIGHALGGMVALQLALDYPHRVQRLVLVNGWMRLSPHTRRCFTLRQQLLLNVGIAAYVHAQPLFLYPAEWLAQHDEEMAQEEAQQVENFQGMENLLRRLHALMSCDYSARLHTIAQPVLLLCARDDVLVPWSCSEQLQAALPNASLHRIEWGGHAVNVTDSNTFNHLLLNWLEESGQHGNAVNMESLWQKP